MTDRSPSGARARPAARAPRSATPHLMALPGALALLVLAPPAAAQTPLGPPDAVFPEDFGAVQTVRELADGRVLVADPLARELYLVDMEAGTRTVVGGRGQGPDEYEQPDAVWPLPGDSTLLVDLGNGRLVVLGPDLAFGPTRPIASGDIRSGGLTLALPQAVDGNGRLYVRGLGLGGGPNAALPDSGVVLRLDRAAGSVDTVATIKLRHRVRRTSGSARDRAVSVQDLPLSPEDAWGVAPDGSVVVARAGEYRVEWRDPSGAVTRGPAVPWEPVRIRDAEKEEWLRAEGRGGGAIQVGVTVENGAVSTRLARGRGGMGGRGAPDEPGIDDYEWPERKPPFHGARIPVDPRGRAWVHRHREAGAPSTWDLFDRSGARVASVALPPGARVVGFGAGHVYAVTFDEFDLSHLERYRLP